MDIGVCCGANVNGWVLVFCVLKTMDALTVGIMTRRDQRHHGGELRHSRQQLAGANTSSAAAAVHVAAEREDLQRGQSHNAGVREHKHQAGGGHRNGINPAARQQLRGRASVGANQHRGVRAGDASDGSGSGQRGVHHGAANGVAARPRARQHPHGASKPKTRRAGEGGHAAQFASARQIIPSVLRRLPSQHLRRSESAPGVLVVHREPDHGELLPLLRLPRRPEKCVPQLRPLPTRQGCHGRQHGLALQQHAGRAAGRGLLRHGAHGLPQHPHRHLRNRVALERRQGRDRRERGQCATVQPEPHQVCDGQ